MLQRLISSLTYRAKWARLGVIYGRSLKLDQIKLNGRRVSLDFPAVERARQEHEFGKVVFDDCYRINEVPRASTILDIGANIGLFTLAARRRFPHATIHAYEPNPSVIPHLRSHCAQTECVYFPVAVGLESGKVSLHTAKEGTLFTTTTQDPSGDVPQISFAQAVEKLGTVDLLKLDCEGAEWDLFEDRTTWNSVRCLTMEYHLWAKKGATIAGLRSALSSLGFDQIDIREEAAQWGMAFATRSA